MRVPVVVAALSALGCAPSFDQTTLVRVRDPAAVAVAIETPRGRAWLLAPGGTAKAAEVPPTMPPFYELVKYVRVDRDPEGWIVATCPRCGVPPEPTVITPFGWITLAGTPPGTIAWREDTVSMRWTKDALFRCRATPSPAMCPRPGFSLLLSTPANNVIEVRHQKRVARAHGEDIGASAVVAFGSVFILAGLAIAIGFSVDQERVSVPATGLGALFVGGGAFFFGTGVRGLLARDEETVIAPPASGR
jgi:hypothetical protein